MIEKQPQGVAENGPMALEQALLNLGVKVRRLEIDLAPADSAAQILDAADKWLGLPDILVNNAAHSTPDGFEPLDAAKLDAHYAVIMRGTSQHRAELAPLGITVNAVDPSATDTGWMTEQMRREWSVPSGVARLNQPDDAACVIVFHASDAARHLTGQVIHARGSAI